MRLGAMLLGARAVRSGAGGVAAASAPRPSAREPLAAAEIWRNCLRVVMRHTPGNAPDLPPRTYRKVCGRREVRHVRVVIRRMPAGRSDSHGRAGPARKRLSAKAASNPAAVPAGRAARPDAAPYEPRLPASCPARCARRAPRSAGGRLRLCRGQRPQRPASVDVDRGRPVPCHEPVRTVKQSNDVTAPERGDYPRRH